MKAENANVFELLIDFSKSVFLKSLGSLIRYLFICFVAYFLGKYFSRKDKFQLLIDNFNMNATQEYELGDRVTAKGKQLKYLHYFNISLFLATAALLWLQWPIFQQSIPNLREGKFLLPIRVFFTLLLVLLANLILRDLIKRKMTRLEVNLEEAKAHKLNFVDEFFDTVGKNVREIIIEAVAGKHESSLNEIRTKIEDTKTKNAKLEAEIEENMKNCKLFTSISDQIINFDWCENCLSVGFLQKPGFLNTSLSRLGKIKFKVEKDNKEQPASVADSESSPVEDESCLCSPRCLPRFLLLCEALATKMKDELKTGTK